MPLCKTKKPGVLPSFYVIKQILKSDPAFSMRGNQRSVGQSVFNGSKQIFIRNVCNSSCESLVLRPSSRIPRSQFFGIFYCAIMQNYGYFHYTRTHSECQGKCPCQRTKKRIEKALEFLRSRALFSVFSI